MSILDTVKRLKQLLPAENFIVTGGLVLNLHGLADSYKDLDVILVNPPISTLETLENFMKAYPAETEPKQYENSPKAIFIFEGVKVDFWVVYKAPKITFEISGVTTTSISHILAEKQNAGRLKDWAGLKKMALKIFDSKKFEAWLLSN